MRELKLTGFLCAAQTVLDDAGAAVGCSTVDDSGALVQARPDAIYFFSPDGRGPCFGSEGVGSCPNALNLGSVDVP